MQCIGLGFVRAYIRIFRSSGAVRLFSHDGEATLVRVMHELQGDWVAFLPYLVYS